jgi:hypothetical protein
MSPLRPEWRGLGKLGVSLGFLALSTSFEAPLDTETL